MKEKRIKVIVEGRISSGEMGSITGGDDNYCTACPTVFTGHIACDMDYDTTCITYNPGGGGTGCISYCPIGHIIDNIYCTPSAPGVPTAHINPW